MAASLDLAVLSEEDSEGFLLEPFAFEFWPFDLGPLFAAVFLDWGLGADCVMLACGAKTTGKTLAKTLDPYMGQSEP